jgi:hypothetical protein
MTVFVQTKIDACAGWRDVLNRNIALMRDAGLSVETWVVSSIGRLRGGWTGDERLTVGSGLPALVGQLQMLWADFEVTGLRIVSHHLVARIAELDARHQDLRERAVRWPPLLANGFATIHADVAFDLRCRVERVRTQLDRTLGDRRPFENWRPMARWLRHRLTLDAQANGELALAASAEFAARAAEHFGLRRPELEPPDEEDPDSAIPRPPRPDAGDQRVVTLSASVNVLMRSWMGFMMYFLIDGIAHLGWSPLVGLIPGGALALTAVIEERRQYIARERSRAAMILHKYVDVASVKAANNSGERLRRLEQRMREHYGRYIDWCEAEMHRERRAVEVRSSELEARPALLKEIDAGLRYYDTLRHRVSTLVAAHLLAVAESTQQQGPRAGG